MRKHSRTIYEILSRTTIFNSGTVADKNSNFSGKIKAMMEACNLFRALKQQQQQQPILNLKLTSSSAARSSSPSSLNLHSGPQSNSLCRHTLGGGKLVKRAYDALLLDAGGTLLQLAKPVEETYAEIGRKHGLSVSPGEIKQGFKRAFSAPWPEKLRYQGDGKPFWKLVVSEATGCADEDYFEEVYGHYAQGQAWRLPTGAYEAMSVLKDSGVKMVVVSNFDNRLRKLLKDLNVIDLFDALIISSEVGYEKPDAEIFKAALDQVRVEARKAVHVGDDEKADKEGANAVEIDCWLWKKDVKTFADIQSRILLS